MDPPNGLVYQSELPFERDAVQCLNGKWRFVRLRRAPLDVVAEGGAKEAIWKIARALADGPIWEEHYEGTVLVDCVPPKGVYRHPQTCFLVVDGSPMPGRGAPAHPDSHVRMKVVPEQSLEQAPETPRSAAWPEERQTDWRSFKEAVIKKIRGR